MPALRFGFSQQVDVLNSVGLASDVAGDARTPHPIGSPEHGKLEWQSCPCDGRRVIWRFHALHSAVERRLEVCRIDRKEGEECSQPSSATRFRVRDQRGDRDLDASTHQCCRSWVTWHPDGNDGVEERRFSEMPNTSASQKRREERGQDALRARSGRRRHRCMVAEPTR